MENISYMELVECQSIAAHAAAYFKCEFGKLPANASEAENAVRWAYVEERLNCDKSWRTIKPYLNLIVDQIGYIVEE